MPQPTISQRLRYALVRRMPGQLVVQITDRCNARCPQCGMRITSDFKRRTLDKKTVYNAIDAAARRNIRAISFTGGEPMLMPDDLCDYINRAGRRNIAFIRTGTNGFLFSGHRRRGFRQQIHRIAQQLAATPVRNFWISLDSWDAELHDAMRGFNNLTAGIEKALPVFHEAGIYPSVNLGINRNVGGTLTRHLSPRDYRDEKTYEAAVLAAYQKAFSLFYQKVIHMGFTIVNACYPMSVDNNDAGLATVYQASAADHIVRFTQGEKKMIFKALHDTIPNYRHRIRIFSPRTALNALLRDPDRDMEPGGIHSPPAAPPFSAPCQGGINYFFINARTGDTFPCGFRGEDNFGPFHKMPRSLPISPACRRCDWECFRDPSELTAPVLDLLCDPLKLVRNMRRNAGYLKKWSQDLLYYRACDYFNGRIPPNYPQLKQFRPPGPAHRNYDE